MDFITNLPNVDGYDAIATFVDMFTKQAHFAPCSSSITATQLAQLFIDNVYKHHGIQRVFVGDRDTKYTSQFWKNLMSGLNTKMYLSTAYRPQTDGSTERVHRTIEQILRALCHRKPVTWVENLSLAEFCYNNSKHASTHTSPFEGLYGLSPLTPVKLIEPPHAETPDILQRIHDIHSLLEEKTKIAKAEQKHHADTKTIIREFTVGDYVLLSTKHLTLYNEPCKKFKDRYNGPYKIMAKYSPHVYKLELPSTMITIHPVFHITSLTPYYLDTPDQDISDHIPTKAHCGQDCFTIEKIVDHVIGTHVTHYKAGPCLLFKIRWDCYT